MPILWVVLRRTAKAAVLGLMLGGLSSCAMQSPSEPTPSKLPKVVATTTIVCDMVKQIARDTVDLTCLLKPGVDGHVYQPVPEDRKAIEDAQLILYSGYAFEPALIKLIQATANPAPKIAVAEQAVPTPLMGHAHETTTTDSDHGHDHTANANDPADTPDPHVWQNAANGARMVTVVQQALIQLVPDRRAQYTQSGTALAAELNAIHAWIKTQIASIPAANRKLVTTHDAMAYYAAAYEIPVEGALQGLSTDEKPTATQVKQLVDQVTATRVPTIFAEVVVNPKLIQAIAREAQVKVATQELYSDSAGEPTSEAPTYPQMLIANTRTIVEGLNGRYVAFQTQPTP